MFCLIASLGLVSVLLQCGIFAEAAIIDGARLSQGVMVGQACGGNIAVILSYIISEILDGNYIGDVGNATVYFLIILGIILCERIVSS